ncbi:MAG: galactokinase [Actinomycetaceae bacterium]|nr:galactokinase [Actinomycetaceae bacterium]
MSTWHTAWTTDEGISIVLDLFRETFSKEPDGVWASPGRVNLIGEHTDYNGGLSLPIALPHRTYVALRRRSDDVVDMIGDQNKETLWKGTVADIVPGVKPKWLAYCAGIAWALREDGFEVPGFDVVIASCVPLGAGLSSSAAVSCAMGLALGDIMEHPFDHDDESRARLAQLCVRAENEVAGAPTGGLDQAASLRAAKDHAIVVDSRDGSVEQVPLPLRDHDLALIVIDTQASHSLADGQYGQRRDDCHTAADLLNVPDLREIADTVAPADLGDVLATLPTDQLRRRVRHVVTEIWRVRDFRAAMAEGDMETAGQLMNASHDSLRDDYEVSVAELDVVVDAARETGALGARMTGGGFGGSAIALVRAAEAEQIAQAIVAAAKQAGHPTPELYLASAGAPGERLV